PGDDRADRRLRQACGRSRHRPRPGQCPRPVRQDMTKKAKSGRDPEELPYRPCIGVALFNRAGRVWIGRRADAPGEAEGAGTWWQMPQGGIDEGEDHYRAALRELYEETSVKSVSLIRE